MSTPIDIPYSAASTLAELAATHARVQLTPDADPTLSYELLLPKSWGYAKQFGPVLDELLHSRGIGYFTNGIEPGDPVVSVTVTRVPFEVPIDSWCRLSVEAEGWSIIAGKWFPGPHGLLFDVCAERVVGDLELVRRTTVRIAGGNIFAVHTICARSRWAEFKGIFWIAHWSFELAKGEQEKRMEPWLRAAVSAPDLETAYPISWAFEAAPARGDGIARVHLRLLDAEGTLLAYLLIRGERGHERVSLPEVLRDSLALLEQSTIRPTEPLHRTSEVDDPRALAIEGWLGGFTAAARWEQADIALRLGFVQRGAVLVTLVLCAPTRQVDVLTSLRAQRVFEIVRGQLSVLEPHSPRQSHGALPFPRRH